MSKKSKEQDMFRDIFKDNPHQRDAIHNIIQEMIKSPELKGLEHQEKEYVWSLIRKLDKAGLEELRCLVEERLIQVTEGLRELKR